MKSGGLQMARKRIREQTFLNPREMFILAEEFLRATRMLGATQRAPGFNMANMVPRPHVMVHAVSVELYLKCLFVLDHSRAPGRIHNLKVLFESLAADTQRAMRTHFDPTVGQAALDAYRRDRGAAIPLGLPSVFTFDFALTASSKAFEHVRFAYERSTRPTEQWHGEPLARAARLTIVERIPEWKSAPTFGASSPARLL